MLTRKNKRSSISSLILLPAIFLVVGVVFLTIGIGLRISDQNKKRKMHSKNSGRSSRYCKQHRQRRNDLCARIQLYGQRTGIR